MTLYERIKHFIADVFTVEDDSIVMKLEKSFSEILADIQENIDNTHKDMYVGTSTANQIEEYEKNAEVTINPSGKTLQERRNIVLTAMAWIGITENDMKYIVSLFTGENPSIYNRCDDVTYKSVTGTDDSGNTDVSDRIEDSSVNFVNYGVKVGDWVKNTTDGGYAEITSITTTTNTNDTIVFSGGLTGGTDNDVDNGDEFTIRKANMWRFDILISRRNSTLASLDWDALELAVEKGKPAHMKVTVGIDARVGDSEDRESDVFYGDATDREGLNIPWR